MTDTVAEIRREHGLAMNSLGAEKPQLLGYGREELVRLLDAVASEQTEDWALDGVSSP
ncbi:hypothetical protein [Streptomyces sp. NPDC000877]|uniref:hypothetical protein n=1 Tax=unclassified Streptomyces TaxID=2593676 RepID=UPI00333267AA